MGNVIVRLANRYGREGDARGRQAQVLRFGGQLIDGLGRRPTGSLRSRNIRSPQLHSKLDRQIALNIKAGVGVKERVFHIHNVNAYDSRLKGWVQRFNGVATRYLDSYPGWRRFLERHKEEAAGATSFFNRAQQETLNRLWPHFLM